MVSTEVNSKLLIGLANNISKNYNKIALWFKSFRKHCDHRVVLIVANPSNDDVAACKKLGIEYISVEIKHDHQINHKRIESIKSFLEKTKEDIILSTDVFDVVFQSDPFKKLDPMYDFFVGGEGVRVNQEPWNHNNIKTLFPNHYRSCESQEVICSGVIAGKRSAVIKVYERMFALCENSSNKHDIQDQAALIYMVANNEISNIKIFTLDDGWVVHAAVSGPTKFFEKWGFSRAIRYGHPIVCDGFICTAKAEPYDIVHQFNRVPVWNQMLHYNYLYKE